MSTLYPDSEAMAAPERKALNLYLVSALVLFLLLMSFGLTMRLAQSAWITISPGIFYQLMTAHGAGMVGTVGLASSAVMWFFLRKYVRLSLPIFVANYVFFMSGATLLLAAAFLGHYGGAWTFLYPLPVHSMGVWSVGAAAVFMLGYLLIGVGFLLFYLDAMLAVIRVYGNLGRALGLQWLFGGTIDKAHPGTVVASTMVIIVNTLGILGGAVVLVMSVVNAYAPEFVLDALFTKNLIYFFGHVFVNSSIYMAVIGVYELLPRYTGRPWTVSRPFLWAWAANTVLVLVVYPHHLMMDFAMPRWAMVVGQLASHAEGLPVFVGNRPWRAHQHLSFRPALAHAGRVHGAGHVRLGGGDRSGHHRRHDQRQPGDAQYPLGARSLPLLSVARSVAHAACLHVSPDRRARRSRPTRQRQAGRRGVSPRRPDARRHVPRRRPRQCAEALCGALRPVEGVRPGGLDRGSAGDLGDAVVRRPHLPRAAEGAGRVPRLVERVTAALRTGLASAALLLAGGVVLAAATDGWQAFTTETARRVAVRRRPADLPAVALENQSGARFTLADRRGTWLLVDFIYTRCPTFCTALGGDFARLERQLADPIARGRVQLLSISFDPTQDTPAQLAAYLGRFRGPATGWQAARPLTAGGLREITAAFGVTVIPDQLGGYTHNAAIHLVDPAGRLVGIFDLGDVDRIRETVVRKLGP